MVPTRWLLSKRSTQAFGFVSSVQTQENTTTEQLRAMGAAHVLQKPFASLSLLARLLWRLVGSDQPTSIGAK
jgi:hypothetical protein